MATNTTADIDENLPLTPAEEAAAKVLHARITATEAFIQKHRAAKGTKHTDDWLWQNTLFALWDCRDQLQGLPWQVRSTLSYPPKLPARFA